MQHATSLKYGFDQDVQRWKMNPGLSLEGPIQPMKCHGFGAWDGLWWVISPKFGERCSDPCFESMTLGSHHKICCPLGYDRPNHLGSQVPDGWIWSGTQELPTDVSENLKRNVVEDELTKYLVLSVLLQEYWLTTSFTVLDTCVGYVLFEDLTLWTSRGLDGNWIPLDIQPRKRPFFLQRLDVLGSFCELVMLRYRLFLLGCEGNWVRGQSSGKVHQNGGGMMTQRMSNESNSSKNKNKSRNNDNDNDNDKNNNTQQHQQRQKSFNALPNIPLLNTLPPTALWFSPFLTPGLKVGFQGLFFGRIDYQELPGVGRFLDVFQVEILLIVSIMAIW